MANVGHMGHIAERLMEDPRPPLFCLLLEGGQQPGSGDRRVDSSKWDVWIALGGWVPRRGCPSLASGKGDQKLKSDNFVQKSTGWHSMFLNSKVAWKWEIMLIRRSLVYRCQRGSDWNLCGTVAVAQARLRGCRNDQEEGHDWTLA